MKKKNKARRYYILLLILVVLIFSVVLLSKKIKRLPPLTGEKLFSSTYLPEDEFNKASEALLNNRTYLTKGFKDYDYNNRETWGELPSTYNLYINCLYDVQHLIYLYKESGDNRYLERGKEIIISWIKYNNSIGSKENTYIWSDHAAAKRSLTLVNFLFQRNDTNNSIYDEDFVKEIKTLLKEHLNWLTDEKNYSLGNHGLMMDTALLELGLYFNEISGIDLSISRIEERFYNDFTKEGIHLENSPDYHILAMNHYIQIKDLLDYYNISNILNPEVYNGISRLSDFLIYITMPNKYLPRIGDSGKTKITNNYDNNELEYLLTNGKSGIEPDTNRLYSSEAGMQIYRSEWDTDALWWALKSGSRNPVHKQDDDLSFMIYYNNNEIFTDAGKFNYDNNSIYRKYALSPEGHNSISIKEERYYASKNLDKIELLELVEDEEDYLWLRGQNSAYLNSIIDRNFIYIKPNIFLIIDRGDSDHEKTYSQHYLFTPNIKIISYNESGISMISDDRNVKVELRQYEEVDDVNLYEADDATGKGYIFEGFEEKKQSTYIEFLDQDTKTTYITTIQINKDDYKNTINSVKIDSNIATIKINNQDYNFELEELELE